MNSTNCSINPREPEAFRVLKLVVGVLCIGGAKPLLEGRGEILEWIVHLNGQAAAVGSLLALLLVGVGVALLFGVYRGCRWCRLLAWLGWGLLPMVVIYFLANALCHWRQDSGNPINQSALLNHAVRYGAPAVLFVWMGPWRKGVEMLGDRWVWVLRAVVSATFLGHGLNMLQESPSHVGLIQKIFENLLGKEVSAQTGEAVLDVIGCVDVALAVLLLIRPWRQVVMWMAFFGFAVAVSCLGAYGWSGGWDKAVVRIANGGVPLVIWMLWTGAFNAQSKL